MIEEGKGVDLPMIYRIVVVERDILPEVMTRIPQVSVVERDRHIPVTLDVLGPSMGLYRSRQPSL
jgi:hypothetical protein